MKRLPADRLPKGTRRELTLLLSRCSELILARVQMPRYSLAALERTIDYLEANDVEGKSLGRDWKHSQAGENR